MIHADPEPKWDDRDRLAAVVVALLPELRGQTHLVLQWVSRPSELENLPLGLPLGLRTRLQDPALWQRARMWMRMARRRGYRIVTWGDDVYPTRLRHIETPPLVLWVQGRWPLDERPTLAVVGSRRATVYGKNAVRLLLEPLAAQVVIVSGLAVGVDAMAHTVCVERGGWTVAVLGHGLDVTYPRHHTRLRADLLARGATFITEFPPDTPPRPELFPMRNRIISGLADAVLVVEAPLQSGALNTARWALEQGKELLAVPGSILRETSLGTNYLIQQGLAHMVIHPRDIVEAVPSWRSTFPSLLEQVTSKTTSPTDPFMQRVWEQLPSDGDVAIETLLQWAEEQGVEPDALYHALFEMELRGLVLSLPGRRYARRV